MRQLAAAAVAAVALAAAGCGGAGESSSDGVEAYVEQANAVQRSAQGAFDRANANYEAFAKDELQGKEAEAKLRSSELEIAGVQDRLATLRPPRAARTLHERLLRTYELHVALAAETRRMAGFVPRSERALAGLGDVRATLRGRLRDARSPAAQIAALRDYARRLDVVRVRLRALEVPSVLVPTHDAQIGRLVDTRALALRLARAIEARDAAAVATLLKAFRSAGGPSPVSQRLAVGAIRGYQQRVVTLTRAEADVRAEQERLLRARD